MDGPAAAAASPGRDLLVGVDVGGTKIAALAVGRADKVLGRSVRPVDPGPSGDVALGVLAAIREAVGAQPDGLLRIAAVGLAFPGRVQPETGHVRGAVNLAFVDEPLGPRIAEALGRPCVLENDVRAGALGVLRHGGPLAAQDMAYLNVGTGIAAGIVLGGRLHRGRHGMAGEVGHVVLDPSGPACRCGLPGCVEALAAGPAIARDATARMDPDVLRAFAAGRPVPSAVYAAADAGDPGAMEVVAGVSAVLARVVHALVMAYDLERVVIGGGVSKVGPPLLERLERQLDGYRGRSPLAREMLGPDLVRLVPADFDAGCWGAVALADALREGEPAGAAA